RPARLLDVVARGRGGRRALVNQAVGGDRRGRVGVLALRDPRAKQHAVAGGDVGEVAVAVAVHVAYDDACVADVERDGLADEARAVMVGVLDVDLDGAVGADGAHGPRDDERAGVAAVPATLVTVMAVDGVRALVAVAVPAAVPMGALRGADGR